MEIENVAGVCLAARRATQQQRDLAVGPGLLGEIVINDEGVLAAIAVVLAHGAAREGCDVLHGSRVGGARHHHRGVVHGAVLFKFAHHGGDRGLLLADGHVDALNPGAFLVDDRVDGDGGLADLAVTDDQLALAAAYRHHRVDGLETCLYRLRYRLAGDNTRRHFLDGLENVGVDGTLAVDGVTQRIDHAAEQRGSDRHLEHAAGAAAGLAFLQALVLAEYHGANRIALEVQRESVDAALEFDHFAVHHLGKSVDADDTVRHTDNGALVARLHADVEAFDAALDDFADFGRVELLHLGFPWIGSVRNSLLRKAWTSALAPSRRSRGRRCG